MDGTVTKIKHFKILVTAVGTGVPKPLFRQCVQHTKRIRTVSSISVV